MLKALPEGTLKHLTLIIQKIWRGEDYHEVWHTMLLTALYNGKRQDQQPQQLERHLLAGYHFQSE
jgi:hypothetical protein